MSTLERCDSMAALTDHEQLVNYSSADSESEGTSSGYDSASDCLSDVHDNHHDDIRLHDNHQLPDLIQYEKPRSKNVTREKMSFQSTNALSNHLKYIISMPELCDVRFVVGDNKVPVYGVKAIMTTRSRTLYHLIIKHQRKQDMDASTKRKKKRSSPQHLDIDVKKYDPEVFCKIIQFVHCGSVDIDVDNVAGLLCGASQFGLEDLSCACWDFVERCLHRNALNQILHSARQYSQHKVTTRLLNKVNHRLDSIKSRGKEKHSDTVV